MRTRAEGRRSEQSERRWDHRRWVAQRLRSNQSLSPPFCDFDNLRQVEKMRSWVTDFDIQKLFPVSLRMNVSLTDKLEDFVNELVEQGRYRSASEVGREGLRLLEIREAQLKSATEGNVEPMEEKKN